MVHGEEGGVRVDPELAAEPGAVACDRLGIVLPVRRRRAHDHRAHGAGKPVHGEHLVCDRVVDGYGEGAAAHEEALEAGDKCRACLPTFGTIHVATCFKFVCIINEQRMLPTAKYRHPSHEKGIQVVTAKDITINAPQCA